VAPKNRRNATRKVGEPKQRLDYETAATQPSSRNESVASGGQIGSARSNGAAGGVVDDQRINVAEGPSAKNTGAASTYRVDKSALTFPEPKRIRDKDHLRRVAAQPCLVCNATPSDPHHVRFAQTRAMSRKVSDEFTVSLCRTHHRELHRSGNEAAWWHNMGIEPLGMARQIWEESETRQARSPSPAQSQ
jgi:hypothetical protein